MKKFAKLSLVAAVAVAGLSTTSSAASLEEAIKGVDISGQFRFRAEERNSDFTSTTLNSASTKTDVEIEVGVKVPVNDNVTAVFKIDNANDDWDNNSVSKGDVEIEDYYFSYVNGALTVNAGQQNIPGRLTDGAQGDGIVALYNLGAATIGAAGFMNHTVGDASATIGNTSAVEGQNALSVIAMGNVGPVSLLGQYVDVADTADSYNLKADVSIDMIKAGVEYSETELDSASSNEYETLKAYVSGNVGIVSAKLSYAKTGDQGSGSLHAVADTLSNSIETPAEFLLWNIGTAQRADFDVIAIDASVALTDKVSLRAAYATGEEGTGANNDVTETLGQISYKMSKNLNTYFRFADVEDKTTEYQRGRVEVRYTF